MSAVDGDGAGSMRLVSRRDDCPRGGGVTPLPRAKRRAGPDSYLLRLPVSRSSVARVRYHINAIGEITSILFVSLDVRDIPGAGGDELNTDCNEAAS